MHKLLSDSQVTPGEYLRSSRWKAAFAGLLLICTCLVPREGRAWHDAGHKIIASLAFRQLSAAERTQIANWLKQHPRFKEDFTEQMPPEVAAGSDEERNEWIFQQAALWPDLARDFEPDAKKLYNQPPWHYIDLPLYLSPDDRTALEGTLKDNISSALPATAEPTMNIIQTIRFVRGAITAKDAVAEQRAVYLCWLFHDIGDIHQPCHSTALYSRKLFPTGDRGGNLILTTQQKNLHFLWDDFIGGRMTFGEARERTAEYQKNADLMALGEKAALDLNEQHWLDESQALATSTVYDPEVMAYARVYEKTDKPDAPPPLTLSEEYLKTGRSASERRIVQAGFRLGAVLKKCVQP